MHSVFCLIYAIIIKTKKLKRRLKMMNLSAIWLHNINEDIVKNPERSESVIKVLDQEIENTKTYVEMLEQYKAKAEYVFTLYKGQGELKI